METRQKIIHCALEQIRRHGMEKFSVRATGSAAGLSAMAMYRHFKDRDDLLQAIGEDAFSVYQQRVTQIAKGSLKRSFEKVARAYAEFALDDPGRFEACFVLRTKVERIYPEDFRAGKSPVIAWMVQRIAEDQQQGRLMKTDPVQLALLLWAQVHGLVMLHRAARFSMDREAFIKLCEKSAAGVLQGLQSPAHSASPIKKTLKVKSAL